MKYQKHQHSLLIFTFIILFSFNSVIINTNAQEEEILTLRVSKNVGTGGIGNKIEGDFTITGTGPEYILNLTLIFNGTQVFFESDNELKFRFNTKDYPIGLMNITLVGKDNEGTTYTKTIFKDFISPEVGNWIMIISIGIVLISLGIKLVSYLKEKRNEKQGVTEKKNQIKIDIDKEFR